MSKFLDGLGTLLTQFQVGVGGTGLRRLRFRNDFSGDLEWNPTADRTLTLPDRSGTIAVAQQYVLELGSTSSLTWHEGNFVSVSPQTYSTIFDITSGGVDLIGGAILGTNLGFQLTIDGVVVISRFNGMLARTSNNTDTFSIISVPAAKAITSMKLEAFNTAVSTTREFGWRIATR